MGMVKSAGVRGVGGAGWLMLAAVLGAGVVPALAQGAAPQSPAAPAPSRGTPVVPPGSPIEVKPIAPPPNAQQLLRPPVVLDPPERQVGVHHPNDIIRTTFAVRNTGRVPLVVKEIKAACSCTQGRMNPMTIPPGGTATLDAAIDLRGSTGELVKDLGIIFEGYASPVSAKMTGMMSYAVSVDPAAARPDMTYAQQLTLSSRDGRPFKILAVNGEAPSVVSSEPAGGERAVKWVVNYQFTAGKMPNLLVFETDHPDAPVVDVPVHHQETSDREFEYIKNSFRDIFVMRKGLNLGVMHQGKPTEFRIQLQLSNNARGKDVTVRTDSEEVDVEIVSSDLYQPGPGVEYVVRVTPKTDRVGYFLAPFYFTLDDKVARIWGAGALRKTESADAGAGS